MFQITEPGCNHRTQQRKEDCIDKWKLIEKHAVSVASDKIAAHIPVKSPHAH